ncbi:KinB-signaling pathway activation protein [Brevibacillus humidisoli]|uniref:KinB-signaling pathway activation protein n=1 Tax=Brevibacillus humidisoli TaxID=2895522 RepID=UPI001E3EE8FB|nr:KinB-signaling pathway activation protein [Brevibacillus humidisoli]UFJ40697.1 KinB-signaling pathway activation protein [Brevibacillus humidisoli]
MNLRNYGWLLGTTLLVGGVGGVLAGFLVAWEQLGGSVGNFIVGTLVNLLVGLTIAVLAEMGFFAYMTLNYLVISFLKNATLWKVIQIGLILFTAFDMVYLRYSAFGQGGPIWPFVMEPLILLAIAVIAAYAKVRLTNPNAWIPTIFFLFVVTVIEWVPGLRQNNMSSALFMIVPLLFCNIWQVMHLHRLTNKSS